MPEDGISGISAEIPRIETIAYWRRNPRSQARIKIGNEQEGGEQARKKHGKTPDSVTQLPGLICNCSDEGNTLLINMRTGKGDCPACGDITQFDPKIIKKWTP